MRRKGRGDADRGHVVCGLSCVLRQVWGWARVFLSDE